LVNKDQGDVGSTNILKGGEGTLIKNNIMIKVVIQAQKEDVRPIPQNDKYNLLEVHKALKLEITLGKILTLVPKHHNKLLQDLEGWNAFSQPEGGPQVCVVEATNGWDSPKAKHMY